MSLALQCAAPFQLPLLPFFLQAVVAMPSATLEEITDYIMDKEAIFESWRRFKAGLASGKVSLNRSYRR